MSNRKKTIKLLETFLSTKDVEGICGYIVDPDGEGLVQVIVVLDIDYIKDSNTKPGFVAKMIREGVKQEIKKWLGVDVYVGSTSKKCDKIESITESKKKYIVTEQQYNLIKEYFDPIYYLKKIMSDAPKYIREPETLKYDVSFQKIVDVIFKYTMKHSPVDNLQGLEVTKVTPQGWGGNMGDDSKGSHTEWIVLLTSVLPKWFNPDDITYRSQMEDFKREFASIANMMGLSSSSPLSQEGFPFDKVKFIIYND
jgi:hypothetical protein